jgi:hypothetical protein
MITCERVDEMLAAWIEGDLDEAGRRDVDAHVRGCLRCAAIVRDINAIRMDAARLPELEPSSDLWAGIAARIEAPVVELAPRRTSWQPRLRWMAAAAAVLVTVTSGITWSIAMRQRATSSPSVATGSPAGGTGAPATLVRDERVAPAVTYDREIERLRLIVDQRRGDLDSATVAVLEASIRTIDRAILDAREALARDSSSVFLTEQLNRVLDKKLTVLRTVALLPAGAS